MVDRNPSRTGKSQKQKHWLQQAVKKIPSQDTAPIESAFEPSNLPSADSVPKKSPQKRPQSLWRKFGNQCKRHLITYIVVIVVPLFIAPVIGLNREVGEAKVRLNSAESDIAKLSSRLDKREENSQEQFSEFRAGINSLSAVVFSIKTYLLNKFGAKF